MTCAWLCAHACQGCLHKKVCVPTCEAKRTDYKCLENELNVRDFIVNEWESGEAWRGYKTVKDTTGGVLFRDESNKHTGQGNDLKKWWEKWF